MTHGKFESARDDYAISREEGEFFYGLVLALRPEICVETGTHKGLSSGYIAQALKDNGFGHLWTYDIKDYGSERLFSQWELDEQVSFVCKGGEEVAQKKINFAFLDGAHDKESVKAEWLNIKPRLAKGAVVVWHNCKPEDEARWNFGITKALDECGVHTLYLPTYFGLRIYHA